MCLSFDTAPVIQVSKSNVHSFFIILLLLRD